MKILLTLADRMTNYGYGSETPSWEEEKKDQLAKALQEKLGLKLLDGTKPLPSWRFTEEGKKNPYLEINGMYGGVRIRKLTHLSAEEINKMTNHADEIYEIIMGPFLSF